MRLCLALCLALAAGGAWADGCPEAPDHSAELDGLMEQVQAAQTEREGRIIANQMWTFWADAPDEPSQEMLDQGMTARSSYDFLRALDRFDKLIGYCPHYAEGYNQRAFVNFLRQDYAAALPDLEQALRINPRHVAAMSGKALTLMGLGRHDEGLDVLREALTLNPWLPERHLLNQPRGEKL